MSSAVFYFLYFASVGILVPYWALYLHHLKLDSVAIATVVAVPSIARTLFPVVYGYMADRWKARRSLIILFSWCQIVPFVLLLWFQSYFWILFCVSLFSLFNAAILPFTEAMAQEEQEMGRLDYGRTRLWGTFSFILLALFFGRLLDKVGDEWILYGLIVSLALQALSAFLLPADRSYVSFPHHRVKALLVDRKVWIFLACTFLMQVSHGSLYSFYSIYLSELGFLDSSIGVQWAVAAGSEVLVFFFAARIVGGISHQLLFSGCLILAAIRWTLVFATQSYAWLTLTQCLHAFTFGVFHITSMRLIQKMFPEGSRSLGQTLYSASSGGFGAVVGFMLTGHLWDRFRGGTFLISSGIALLAFLISLLFLSGKNPGTPGRMAAGNDSRGEEE